MENWKAIRQDVLVHGLSQRAACEKYQLGWHTLKKILAHAEPRGIGSDGRSPIRILLAAMVRTGQPVPQILGEAQRRRLPVGRPLRERLQTNAVQLARDRVIELSGRTRFGASHLFEERLWRIARERTPPGQQFVKHHPEAEYIAPPVNPVPFPTRLLGTHVRRSANVAASLPHVLFAPCQSKVSRPPPRRPGRPPPIAPTFRPRPRDQRPSAGSTPPPFGRAVREIPPVAGRFRLRLRRNLRCLGATPQVFWGNCRLFKSRWGQFSGPFDALRSHRFVTTAVYSGGCCVLWRANSRYPRPVAEGRLARRMSEGDETSPGRLWLVDGLNVIIVRVDPSAGEVLPGDGDQEACLEDELPWCRLLLPNPTRSRRGHFPIATVPPCSPRG